MKLHSMKMTSSEAKAQSTPAEVDAPRYPWGLAITLDQDSLDKLDMTGLPDVGEEYLIGGCVKVTSVSSNEHEGGKHKSVSLQITELGLAPKPKGKDAADTLYDGDKAEK